MTYQGGSQCWDPTRILKVGKSKPFKGKTTCDNATVLPNYNGAQEVTVRDFPGGRPQLITETLKFVILPQFSAKQSGEGGTLSFRLFPGHLGLGQFLGIWGKISLRKWLSPSTKMSA